MKRVMFVCKNNSRRSQMAEGFARQLGSGKIEVTSAGLEASQIDPMTIQAMSEVGVDISHQISKRELKHVLGNETKDFGKPS